MRMPKIISLINCVMLIILSSLVKLHDSMTPKDMEKLIGEMETMDEAQKTQLKSMGMDPDTSEFCVIVIDTLNIARNCQI